MIRNQLALLCTALLLWCSSAAGTQSQSSPENRPVDLKARITQIPTGSIVEVKLVNKQKIRGRLGSITDSGFSVQYASNDKVVSEILAFETVKSVKEVGKGMHFGVKVVIGTLISMGVIALIGAILCVTGVSSS